MIPKADPGEVVPTPMFPLTPPMERVALLAVRPNLLVVEVVMVGLVEEKDRLPKISVAAPILMEEVLDRPRLITPEVVEPVPPWMLTAPPCPSSAFPA